MKYIDAEKLIAEIERLKKETPIGICEYDKGEENGRMEVLTSLQSTIASLQQEQPNKYETALEKAREWMPNVNQGGHTILIDIFPELGEGLDHRYGGRKQGQPEGNFKKEYNEQWGGYTHDGLSATIDRAEFEQIARHFYELGLNARKEK